uniref:Uncharacterized protein n=1 Tax=Podoviridae sp. ctval4 TaxID=2826585 RepID=A0A8S5MZE9_9CAUD|nr:MAG TPA: hypothetical protein [Podoviridae sp. ctval4]
MKKVREILKKGVDILRVKWYYIITERENIRR